MMYRIHLETFAAEHYEHLISWIHSPEDLMQFAGPAYTYPLTIEQLDEAMNDANRKAFRVTLNESNICIGHAEIYLFEESARLGRVLIGSESMRGKGFGTEIIRLLLDKCFNEFGKSVVDLNVFDWNIRAIKCYERIGFKIVADKKLEREVNGEVWTAINMAINRDI